MNILLRIWYFLTRPFRMLGTEKGAKLCKVCGEVLFTAGDLKAAEHQAKGAGAFLGWRCDTCGTRGGFGVDP
jgi:hypothetical protein